VNHAANLLFKREDGSYMFLRNVGFQPTIRLHVPEDRILKKMFSLINSFRRNNRTFKTFDKERLRNVRLKFYAIFCHIMLQVD
jgi:hypothetical protein